MPEVGRLPIAPHIEEAAADWVARRDSGELDAQGSAEFDDWLRASPAHRAAFNLYENLWSDFDALASRPKPIPAAAPANDPSDARFSRRSAIAAGFALAVISGATFAGFKLWGGSSEIDTLAAMTTTTAIGEQRSITLADSSRVTLNTNTSLVQEFSSTERRLVLERGEALFEVAHDRSRPFVVMTPQGSVTAVGTKFRVRVASNGRLDVLVTEGRVLVLRPGGAGNVQQAGPEQLAAGQQLRADSNRVEVAQISGEEANRDLAWRQGDVIFTGEPLARAAAEMQRYSTTRIDVDPAVAHYSVGGYFRTNDVEAFLQTVEQAFPVRVIRSQGEVRLVARPS
jgi:transmembrane sensor